MSYAIPNSDNIHRTQLDNGITLLVYENHNAPSVTLVGSVNAGSLFDDLTLTGVSSMTATSLMRGTETQDFDTIHRTLEDIGADLSYGSGRYTVGFSGKSLAEDLSTLLDMLNDTLRYPTFPADQIEQLRNQRITSMKYQENDTRYQAGRAFREALYPTTHPYHFSTAGTIDTLTTITPDHLRDFHKRHFGPQGMLLIIVGDVDAKHIIEQVQAVLGDWENDKQPSLPTPLAIESPQKIHRIDTTVAGKTQNDIVMGMFGPHRHHPLYQAATLANSILGEFGMMGRIGHSIREEGGLAYYAYSTMDVGLHTGTWRVAAGVNPKNVTLAIEKAQAELRKIISEPVSQADLEDNQSYFTGRLPLRLSTNAGLASTLLGMERYELSLDYLVHYADNIRALTVDDLLEATQTFITPDAMIISVAGAI